MGKPLKKSVKGDVTGVVVTPDPVAGADEDRDCAHRHWWIRERPGHAGHQRVHGDSPDVTHSGDVTGGT